MKGSSDRKGLSSMYAARQRDHWHAPCALAAAPARQGKQTRLRQARCRRTCEARQAARLAPDARDLLGILRRRIAGASPPQHRGPDEENEERPERQPDDEGQNLGRIVLVHLPQQQSPHPRDECVDQKTAEIAHKARRHRSWRSVLRLLFRLLAAGLHLAIARSAAFPDGLLIALQRHGVVGHVARDHRA